MLDWKAVSMFSLDDIGKRLATLDPTAPDHGQLMAELERRQLIEQVATTIAQKDAAQAARSSVIWMRNSVIVQAVFAILTFALSAWQILQHR